MDSQPPSSEIEVSDFPHFFYNYFDIIFGIIFGISTYFFHQLGMTYASTASAALAIGAFSITVSEIAEILAHRLEEPYASFVLTFSAVAVEIILLFMIILESTHSPSALDTVKGGIISAVIVDMNVLLGIAVFVGGLGIKEQIHNADTSSTYTTILLVASSALLVPSIITYTNNGVDELFQASIMIAITLVFFYIAIFIFQTKTHQHFFKTEAKIRIFQIKKRRALLNSGEYLEEKEEDYIFDKLNNFLNLIFIFILIFFIGVFSEIFAKDGMHLAREFGISTGLAGLIIAIVAVSPEIFTAIRAAQNDQMQRVVNIAMGASTVSILLTVPILMGLAYINGVKLPLDFNAFQIGALILTIILAWKTTANGETNYFEGVSHLMFFVSYAIIATMYH